ncbi:MAG: argininosuccinate lyase, partial [Deltaproteobacteria bacterium]|nr:argininosuccinate lyase [Deltaproteobacteria bacterium]
MAKKKLDKKNKEKTEPKQGTKLWGGRFSEATDRLTEELNASIGFDIRLLSHDIKGSVAHASGLERAGILTPKEREKIEKGLKSVEEDILSGRFVPTIADEDIHMAVEGRLTSKIGSLGGKLHTARSRNDQVALDTRLFLREETTKVIKLLKELQKTLCQVSEKNIDVIMPGYTHLQRAQPILFAHHMLAYQEMIKRDRERFTETLKRIDVMPLGSGALAGSPYNIDRRYVAKLLGFKKISTNSMDAVASRDVLLEFLSNSAILMINLSRLSEELVLWNSEEFGFIELSDAFTTGSSIMPQK